jgi:hypothetical protein
VQEQQQQQHRVAQKPRLEPCGYCCGGSAHPLGEISVCGSSVISSSSSSSIGRPRGLWVFTVAGQLTLWMQARLAAHSHVTLYECRQGASCYTLRFF